MNTYLPFITDAHLLSCIGNLYDSYTNAKRNLSLNGFYKNKIDVFKFLFAAAAKNRTSVSEQIAKDNYPYYKGFLDL